MGKHKQWEMDLEKRLQESGIFKNATQANMQEKIEEFLNSETPEQAKQDLEYFNKIKKRAEDEQLKREIEQYDIDVGDTRVLSVLNEFFNASMEERDAVLNKVIRVLNNAKNKYDKIKLYQKRSK